MRNKISHRDLVEREARRIARERLERALSIDNLPLPKDSALELHLNQMLEADPQIRQLAARHVEAKADAYTKGLELLGLTEKPIDLDIQL